MAVFFRAQGSHQYPLTRRTRKNQMMEPTRVVPRKERCRVFAPQESHVQPLGGIATSAPARTVATAGAPHAGQPAGARSPLQPHAVQKRSPGGKSIPDEIGGARPGLE
jgi:hypothetical protein